jgi:hypothetical protein
MPSLPFLTDAPTDILRRDLSFETLKSHARSRSLHAPPLTLAELYDVCGAANEMVRNQVAQEEFAVVWLGETPDGSRARSAGLPDLADIQVLVCVVAGKHPCTVLWHDGAISAPTQCADEALRACHTLFTSHQLACDDFFPINAAHARLQEWAATRAAAVVATAARAWVAGAAVLGAIEALPPPDAFVVQHDRTAKHADAAIAEVFADDGTQTPHKEFVRPAPPAQTLASDEVCAAFNDRVRVFF